MIAGWLLLPDQELSVRELVGCAIMFSAIILAQFAEKKQENVKEKTTE